MRPARTFGLLAMVAVLLAVARVAPAQEEDAPAVETGAAAAATAGDGPAADPEPAPLPEGEMEMVKVSIGGRTVLGRVVSEDDTIVRIEAVGGGVTGYDKRTVGITRFTVSRSGYHEQHGDHYRQKAWDSDDAPGRFVRARIAYQEALAHAESEKDGSRIQKKLAAMEGEREEWHAEGMRRIEEERARREIELLRLEAQLTEEKLAALARQDEQIRKMALALQRIQEENRYIVNRLGEIDDGLDELDDDIDRLRNLDRHYTRTTIFLDLKGSHDRLAREVDRLRREMGRK